MNHCNRFPPNIQKGDLEGRDLVYVYDKSGGQKRFASVDVFTDHIAQNIPPFTDPSDRGDYETTIEPLRNTSDFFVYQRNGLSPTKWSIGPSKVSELPYYAKPSQYPNPDNDPNLINLSDFVTETEMYDHTSYPWIPTATSGVGSVAGRVYKYGTGKDAVYLYTDQDGVVMGAEPDSSFISYNGKVKRESFTERPVDDCLLDIPNAEFFGVVADAAYIDNTTKRLTLNANPTDNTSALQAMLDWSSETGKMVRLTGFVGHSSRLVHKEFAKVYFDGYLIPFNWDSSTTVYEINSEFYDADTPDLSPRYLTDTTEIRGTLRINPGFGNSVPAVGVVGERGAGVIVENAIIHGCRKGGFFIKKGYEWNTGRIIATAPEDVEAGAQLFYTNTSDGNHQYIGGKGYNKGIVIDSSGTNNTVERAHPWGYTSTDTVQGANNKLLIGFEVQGGYNTIKSGCADTVRRSDPSQPASYANGGIGFYSNGYGNNIESPLTIAQAVDGEKQVVNVWVTEPDNSITNALISTPDGIENEGEVRFSDNADITNTTIVGGNVGAGWLYTTKDKPRNLTNNLSTNPAEPNQYQRIKYDISKEIVTGTIAISQYITSNASTDPVNFFLPDIFAACEGDFAVYDTSPFSDALTADWVSIVALFRNGVLRFQRRKLDGSAETIKQNQIKQSSGTGGTQADMFRVNINMIVALPAR